MSADRGCPQSLLSPNCVIPLWFHIFIFYWDDKSLRHKSTCCLYCVFSKLQRETGDSLSSLVYLIPFLLICFPQKFLC